jgi:hypothetical protein
MWGRTCGATSVKQDYWDDGSSVDRRGSGSFSRSSSKGKARFTQRDRAVGRQAYRVLATALLDLADGYLDTVSPAPDSTRLEVRVVCPPGSVDAVRAYLADRAAWLRQQVAQGLRRRKAPELVFVVVASTEGGQR